MALVNLYKGKHINYQGGDAVVVSNNYSDNTITLLYNGKMITVNRNESLFESNKYATKVIENSQEHISSLDKEIAEGEAKIKESNKLWSAAVKNIRKFKNGINTLLSSLGVKSGNEITDSKAREEYLALSRNVNSATLAKHRASSDVIWYAHRTVDAILDRHDFQLQQSLAENFA